MCMYYVNATAVPIFQTTIQKSITVSFWTPTRTFYLYSVGTSVLAVSIRLNLNSVNQLIFVMVKCGVLFEVRTEFLNNI
jgi:hypothetical protein